VAVDNRLYPAPTLATILLGTIAVNSQVELRGDGTGREPKVRGMGYVVTSFAGHQGQIVPKHGGYGPTRLTVIELGKLSVPSGLLLADDIFTYDVKYFVTPVPAGIHRAFVTLADVSEEQDGSHLREAYLSLEVLKGEATLVEVVVPDDANEDEPDDEDDMFYMIPVDSGTVALKDAQVPMPQGDEWEQGWIDQIEDPGEFREGSANIALPGASHGENVVVSFSGWGDGSYPLLKTYDSAGRLLGVHIDLLALGWDIGHHKDSGEDA
jgi:hypothetical protein